MSRSEFVIAKVRYSMWLGEDGWIIDQFLGRNAPLLLSEVERGGPVVDLAIPSFCVSEVSEDDRFRNEYLAHKPFGTWSGEYLSELGQQGPTFVDTLGHNHFEETEFRRGRTAAAGHGPERSRSSSRCGRWRACAGT